MNPFASCAQFFLISSIHDIHMTDSALARHRHLCPQASCKQFQQNLRHRADPVSDPCADCGIHHGSPGQLGQQSRGSIQTSLSSYQVRLLAHDVHDVDTGSNSCLSILQLDHSRLCLHHFHYSFEIFSGRCRFSLSPHSVSLHLNFAMQAISAIEWRQENREQKTSFLFHERGGRLLRVETNSFR